MSFDWGDIRTYLWVRLLYREYFFKTWSQNLWPMIKLWENIQLHPSKLLTLIATLSKLKGYYFTWHPCLFLLCFVTFI